MRLKLDENMPAGLPKRLRDARHDVETAIEEGLAGKGDAALLAAAAADGRILITFDLDFADIRRYPPGAHAGIVVFRLQDQRWQTLKERVDRLLASDVLSTLDCGLAIVDETRVRYRRPKR